MDLLSQSQLHKPPGKALEIPGPLVQRQVTCCLSENKPSILAAATCKVYDTGTRTPPLSTCYILRPLKHSICSMGFTASLVGAITCCPTTVVVFSQVLLWSQTTPRIPLVYAASWWASETVDSYLADKSLPIWVSLAKGHLELFREIQVVGL